MNEFASSAQILLCMTLAFPLCHRNFRFVVGSTSSVQPHPAHFPGALLAHTGFLLPPSSVLALGKQRSLLSSGRSYSQLLSREQAATDGPAIPAEMALHCYLPSNSSSSSRNTRLSSGNAQPSPDMSLRGGRRELFPPWTAVPWRTFKYSFRFCLR